MQITREDLLKYLDHVFNIKPSEWRMTDTIKLKSWINAVDRDSIRPKELKTTDTIEDIINKPIW